MVSTNVNIQTYTCTYLFKHTFIHLDSINDFKRMGRRNLSRRYFVIDQYGAPYSKKEKKRMINTINYVESETEIQVSSFTTATIILIRCEDQNLPRVCFVRINENMWRPHKLNYRKKYRHVKSVYYICKCGGHFQICCPNANRALVIPRQVSANQVGESPSLGPCIPLGRENMPLGMSARLVKCNFFAAGLGVMFWEYKQKQKLYVFLFLGAGKIKIFQGLELYTFLPTRQVIIKQLKSQYYSVQVVIF